MNTYSKSRIFGYKKEPLVKLKQVNHWWTILVDGSPWIVQSEVCAVFFGRKIRCIKHWM